MLTTIYAIMKHYVCLTKYNSIFTHLGKGCDVIMVINKNLLILCITYYSGLEILLIQSSKSHICVFVDPCWLMSIKDCWEDHLESITGVGIMEDGTAKTNQNEVLKIAEDEATERSNGDMIRRSRKLTEMGL